jgi:hypothetical protein
MRAYRIRGLSVPSIDVRPGERGEESTSDLAEGGGRFNLFQRMMLRWRELHPYNPVHVVRIPKALDAGHLRACIGERLQSAGLTGMVIDRERWRFRYEGGPEAVQLTIAAADDPITELSRAIEREFNLQFASGARAHPFRFLAIDDNGAFYLALAYDHFVAGGDSIARLLTGIACAYTGRGSSALTAVERYPATYRSLLLRHPIWLIRAIAGLPALIARTRKALRPHYGNFEDAYNAFTYFRLDPAQMQGLRNAAAAWEVTHNDLLMACLLQALAPLATGSRSGQKRTEIAVASILNVRQDFPGGASEALSPCLAAFRVSHPQPDGIGLRPLAQEVHAVSARVRRGHLYLQSILALGVSALLWPLLSARQRHRFYPKHYPSWAGITTININPIWDRAECADAALDYLRAVPTGPLCPLVFAFTTAHDVLHVGVSFRTTALSRVAVDGVAAEFVRCIDRLRAEPLQ